MKLAIFGSEARLGAIVGDQILDLERAAGIDKLAPEKGQIFRALIDLIESGNEGLDLADLLIEKFGRSDRVGLLTPLATATLHAPFPGRRLAMAGNNFAHHVADAFTNFGKPITASEVYEKSRQGEAGGFWVVSPPVGPGSAVPIPNGADGVNGLFDFEGELAVILGKGGKGLDADQWSDRIWGSTLVIDWSLRRHDIFANQRAFYGHKVFDGGKSIGPWINVGEVDPTDCDIETWVNGVLRQRFNTADMIFGFGEIFAQISTDFTLLPGDMLGSGTGPGTAADKSVPGADGLLPLDLFLTPGDVVEVKANGLGTLRGRVAPPSGK
ncbi:MAG: fumarylacetoacetate hydrolase family protein [Sphingobium sp.]|uniref:fumarylacetoacetate hydrolase family protein n=1 Tax=Sphingobium sp. TaxID=1912891 RepID=UPI0029AB399E|nr:fumarylacetoacetate hydrolase family protein [Sphingobium sp.]MDX3911572.1 fumarylacetoacetate hydrolase family protein [Sphingobium sp.]